MNKSFNVETDVADIMNQEIVRELMLEINPNLTEEKFLQVWGLCGGNPFNAGLLCKMQEIVQTRQHSNN